MDDYQLESLSQWTVEGSEMAVLALRGVLAFYKHDRKGFSEVLKKIAIIGSKGTFDLSVFQGNEKQLICDLAVLTAIKLETVVHRIALKWAESGKHDGSQVMPAIMKEFGFE